MFHGLSSYWVVELLDVVEFVVFWSVVLPVPVLPLPWRLDEGPVAVLREVVDGEVEAWPLEAPWLIFAVEFTSVDDWFADVELLVVLLPLPTFTPGLTFALAFKSELLIPTFASTPTLGLMLYVRLVLVSDGVALEPVELAEPEMPLLPVVDELLDMPVPAFEFEFSVLPFTTPPEGAVDADAPDVVVLGTA